MKLHTCSSKCHTLRSAYKRKLFYQQGSTRFIDAPRGAMRIDSKAMNFAEMSQSPIRTTTDVLKPPRPHLVKGCQEASNRPPLVTKKKKAHDTSSLKEASYTFGSYAPHSLKGLSTPSRIRPSSDSIFDGTVILEM